MKSIFNEYLKQISEGHGMGSFSGGYEPPEQMDAIDATPVVSTPLDKITQELFDIVMEIDSEDWETVLEDLFEEVRTAIAGMVGKQEALMGSETAF